jgi:hypothetical protein
VVIGEEDYAQIRAAVEEYRRQLVARNIDDAFERLFPLCTHDAESTRGLISKFIMVTEPVEKDRNHVRAHRANIGSWTGTNTFSHPTSCGISSMSSATADSWHDGNSNPHRRHQSSLRVPASGMGVARKPWRTPSPST